MKKIIIFSLTVLFSSLFLWGCGPKKSEETSAEKYTASLQELAKKGKPFKCSFEVNEDGVVSSGIYYMDPSSEMTRGETRLAMEVNGEQQEVINYMIFKDKTVYSWQKGNDKGIIFKDTETKEDGDETSEDDNDFAYSDEKMDFSCVDWKVDKKMFDLPEDVTFDDITKQMEQYITMPENMEDMEGMENMEIDMSQYMNIEE